ncbi:hypothetical protein TSAR_016183 [Trichomalopsis sarcophagae]|uniref:Uncharacterized protein n=1 Tax=Trichomalopsis sarcophagae TaxID=543379 RepID=A0A232FIQ5_9HYME|nr:hypothetical protein TSAR_016183 [Trichomalopsis sarcophagae]
MCVQEHVSDGLHESIQEKKLECMSFNERVNEEIVKKFVKKENTLYNYYIVYNYDYRMPIFAWSTIETETKVGVTKKLLRSLL